MDCSTCQSPLVRFAVPAELRGYLPEESAHAGLCSECLTLELTDDAPPEPRFEYISDAFPTDPEAAVPLALAIGLLDSLALHRSDIETLLVRAEAAGVDPLLVLDRLHAQGGTDPDFDLDRRRHQIEQLM